MIERQDQTGIREANKAENQATRLQESLEARIEAVHDGEAISIAHRVVWRVNEQGEATG
jgi:hypothetical protein